MYQCKDYILLHLQCVDMVPVVILNSHTHRDSKKIKESVYANALQ